MKKKVGTNKPNAKIEKIENKLAEFDKFLCYCNRGRVCKKCIEQEENYYKDDDE